MSELTKEQKIQEAQYEVPYHWFFKDDEWRGRNYFGYCRAALSFAKKHGFDPGTMRALDAGCGDARFTKLLLEQGVCEVAGLDYSEHSLAFARVFLPETKFETKDLTDPNFALGRPYDVVFLIETLEHIDPGDVPMFVKNLGRCLKDKGLLIVTVPSTLLELHDKHYQHFTPDSLKKSVVADFDVLEVVGYNSTHRPDLAAVYKLIHNRLWEITPLRQWWNKNVWPKYQCIGPADKGRGLLLVARKK